MSADEKREEVRPAVTGEDRLPGDPAPEELIARMIRVDHAGEYGAKRIYDGQLAVLGKSGAAPAIREMAEAEQAHLDTFDALCWSSAGCGPPRSPRSGTSRATRWVRRARCSASVRRWRAPSRSRR